SGIVSYILTKRLSPVQKPMYFTNSSISPNGEYLVFYTHFPPSKGGFLAMLSLNPEDPWIEFYPETRGAGIPMFAPDSSGLYFMLGTRLCFKPIRGETKVIGSIPEDYIKGRYLYRNVTHLSLSADGKWFLGDGEVGDDTFIYLMDAKTGEFKLLHEFNYRHNHAAFSTVNPKQFLIPRDWRRDASTGKYEFMENRLYVMDVDQTYYRSLNPDFWEGKDGDTAHEWWSQEPGRYRMLRGIQPRRL
ncbi:MAG: hypothetical protein J6S21_01220, partial [Victivallales bacterium]|nr:hypothetical protein [Victivallales bacterium]